MRQFLVQTTFNFERILLGKIEISRTICVDLKRADIDDLTLVQFVSYIFQLF